jgi:hypothetical protein
MSTSAHWFARPARDVQALFREDFATDPCVLDACLSRISVAKADFLGPRETQATAAVLRDPYRAVSHQLLEFRFCTQGTLCCFGVVWKLVKTGLELVVFAFAAYAFVCVPLGHQTALQHARNILGTREAQDARGELKQAGSRIVGELLDYERGPLRGEPKLPKLKAPSQDNEP